jgi:tetratricopeptide (TPR) repeat protein
MRGERRTGCRWRWIAGLVVACATAIAQAQILDTVEVTAEGANAVVRIRFNVLIQYLRHVPTSSGSSIQVFFQVTASDEAATAIVEEERRPPPSDLVPRVRVVYPSQAPGVQRRLDITFEQPITFRLRPEDNRTLVVLIPLTPEQLERLRPPKPAGVELPPSAVVAAPATDIDRDADVQMKEARDAMAGGAFDKAVVAFNRVLNLPPNAYSQEAQELIGLAREKDGDIARARTEYELYLKLYPDAPAAARIRAHLAELAVAPIVARAPTRPPQTTWWGSVSQTYYGGKSNGQLTTTTVTPATNATTIDTIKLSAQEQSLLVNTFDGSYRYRDTNWDNRVVVREQYNANFIGGRDNENRLNALYAEARYLPQQLFARVGRQSATSNGVLGRYDGAVGAWGFAPNARVAAVVGQPVDTFAGLNKTFYGAALEGDFGGTTAGANLFAIRQVVKGESDRLGIGGEARYFDPQRTMYGLVDYDPLFHAFNIAMGQGTFQWPTGTTLNLLADYRRTPTLQLTNALIADPSQSFDDLVSQKGIGATRDQAKALTPISKVFLVGLTQQFSPRWQVGVDVRWSSLSGTPATGILPETPGTGAIWTYTAQLIGNGLTPWQDILVVGGSVLRGKTTDAEQVNASWRFSPRETITLEPGIRWYRQQDANGLELTRTTPSLKFTWRIKDRFAIEGEGDFERSRTTGPTTDENVDRIFYYLGWRWDF